jgi:hypothetical protein
MNSKLHQHRALAFVLLITIVLLLFAPAECQVTADNKSKKKYESRLVEARWQYMLDDLAREAHSVPQEEKRPLLMAEVADAYWDIDQTRARALFTAALEAALSLKVGTDDASRALRQVIKMAVKRDATLARKLSEKVIEMTTDKDWAAAESLSIATDLLESDPARAAQLVHAQAPAGPSLNTAWFILQLSRRDPAAADKVYSAYLSRFAPGTGFGLDRLLWLAGYPFGYAEAFGGSMNPNQMVGFYGLRIPGPGPRPALAQMFLDVAFRASQHALKQTSSADPQQAEAICVLVLFTTAYLLPEVQRYRPQILQQWTFLEQEALSRTTVIQRDGVIRRIEEIARSRASTGEQEAAEQYSAGQEEALLAHAEDHPSGCKRDTEFVKASLSIAYAKDFSRAIEVSGRIENGSLRDSVRQYIYYDMSIAAVARGDSASLDDARKYAEYVISSDQRALLYIKIAKAVIRHQDRQLATELLGRAMRLAETASEPTIQTGILLASAASYAEFDAYSGYKALKEAVKVINNTQSQNVDDFSILRKVNLACRAGEDTWYGDSVRAEHFSLFEIFAAMANTDPNGMILLARDLDDPSMRIRSLIAITKAMTKKTNRELNYRIPEK